MQSQFLRSGIATPTGSVVAAVALCASVLYATDARAQMTVGGIRIGVPGEAVSSATARAVLSTIVRDRIARGRTTSARKTTSAARVLPTAERYLGVPYRWGGTSPKTGFDCSGFVQYVFAKHGTRLPRTSREMASSGQRLSPVWSTLKPGDLVLFAEPGKRISHVAIYAGKRRIIHASGSGRRVRYDALDTKRGKWFARRIVSARRVSPHGAALVSDLLAQHAVDAVVRKFPLDPPDRAPLP
jgi:cell wall-associated NlpC family hydrolase